MTTQGSRISQIFGEDTFSFTLMKQLIPKEFYDKLMFAIRNHRPISADTADVIAHAMKEWALSRGATHYTHWFMPLTGSTAEKHDAFLTFDDDGNPIERFSGKQLIVSEPDASSFPHGGLRSTFEARGYAMWDPSSPAFLMRRGDAATLCLPSLFISYTGVVLDKKTPLLRSIAAVSKAAVRMLRLLGNKRVTGVEPYVGAEQEYFLVPMEHFKRRPDLRENGVTLLGAGPVRGEQIDDHYFRSINDHVLDFMEEVEDQLYRLGVPVKTRHNEVAPAQYELAPLHRPANVAADQNQLVMETLRKVAPRHGFVALLHEKPFARVNGSGKHNNWSLIDSEGTNLLQPGRNVSGQLRFLLFLIATVKAIQTHGRFLQSVVANAGNDMRLGGHEAPPNIISIHLGDHLTDLLAGLAEKEPTAPTKEPEIELGVGGAPRIPKDTTDRNRTSPFAFTGNKFEFRALGSSTPISLTNVVINTAVAEALDAMSDLMEEKLDKGTPRVQAGVEVLRQMIQETEAIRFNGDNYSAEWEAEATRRKLPAAKNTAEALQAMVLPETIALCEKYGILTAEELEARQRIKLDFYAKTVSVELEVMRRILGVQVLPAGLRYQADVAQAYAKTKEALGGEAGLESQKKHLAEIVKLTGELVDCIGTLEADTKALAEFDEPNDAAAYCANEVRPHMRKARGVSDRIEELVDDSFWPLPSYAELLNLG